MEHAIEPGTLRQNLENIHGICDPDGDNQDWPIGIEGEEGSGKSALAQAIAISIDNDFDPEKQIALSSESFKQKARQLDPQKPIIFDEGVDGLMATDTMTTTARDLVKFFRRCRELNLIPIINMPVFLEMNKKIRKKRVKTLFRSVKHGFGADADYWAAAWNKTQIRRSDLGSNKPVEEAKYPQPAIQGIRWPDPRTHWPDIWNAYIEMKNQDVRHPEQEEDEIDLGQVVRIVKNRIGDYKASYQGQEYIDKDLIAHDFDIGGRKARRVKKVAERDLGLGNWSTDSSDTQ